MRRLLLAATTLLLLACGGVAHAATTATFTTLTASEGIVTATLTYQQSQERLGNNTFSDLNLRIARAGAVYYAQPVSSPACGSDCRLEIFDGHALAVADLEGDGQPDVVLHLNSAGAHCCTIVQILAFDPGVMTYHLIERNFGDPAALLTNVSGDGRLEFESADDRFAYRFASYAYSGLPVQIWRFSAGRFIDVTRRFPKLVAADARRQFTGFLANRRRGLGLGLIAAWAADEYLLGKRVHVARTLAREARLHRLEGEGPLNPGGHRFIKLLDRFLRKTGYA